MRPLFLLFLLIFVVPSQNPTSPQEESSLKVLGSKSYKTRQAVENVDTASVAPYGVSYKPTRTSNET